MLTPTARNGSAAVLVLVLVLDSPGQACAGMPMVLLSDLARMRFQTISFFLLVLLGCSWIIQRIWNCAATRFPGHSPARLQAGRRPGHHLGPPLRPRADDDLGCSRADDAGCLEEAGVHLRPGRRCRESRSSREASAGEGVRRRRQNRPTMTRHVARHSTVCGSPSGSTHWPTRAGSRPRRPSPRSPRKLWRTADPSGLHFVYQSRPEGRRGGTFRWPMNRASSAAIAGACSPTAR